MKLRALSKHDRKAAISLLEQERDANLFQLDALDRRAFSTLFQDRWWGVFQNKQLLAVNGCFGREKHGVPARLLIPYGEDSAVHVLGRFEQERGGSDMVLGCREATDAFLQGLGCMHYRTFYNQRIYSCSNIRQMSFPNKIHFQRANSSHLAQIVDLSARMMLEDLGKDPRLDSEQHYRETIRRRILEGRSFIGQINNQIVFLLDLGTNGPRGCQVGGTYVPPSYRNQGIATQGMYYWTSRLLKKYGLVTLHVNEANLPAIRCYERIGFRKGAPYRLAILNNSG